MHIIQKELIKRLMNENGLKFSQLTNGFDSDDNIVFHLKKMIILGYLKKQGEKYFITHKGIGKTSDFDPDSLIELGSKPLHIGFICKYGDKYVIKKHDNAQVPFFNLPNGRPYHKESLEQSFGRISKEEINLDIQSQQLVFDSLHMKDLVTADGEVLFSDVFVVYSLKLKSIKGLNKNMVLMNISQVEALENKWPEIDICILRKGWKPYQKYTIESDYIL